MGFLKERLKESMSIINNDIIEYYKENTIFMYEKYMSTSDDCKSININEIEIGRFYHLVYKDDSNWMKYSPIFCCDYRNIGDVKLILGVNFNFIPLELRVVIFDEYISDNMVTDNRPIPVDFLGIYKLLIRYGFEYAIQEYNLKQISKVHEIKYDLLPRFMYSSFPSNKYDPNKLIQIWEVKMKNREKRHQELISSNLNDFYNMKDDLTSRYSELGGHIKRNINSYKKYGGG